VEAYFDDLYHGEDAPMVKNDDRPRNKNKSRGKEEFERSGKSGGKPGKNKEHHHADNSSSAGAVVDGVARLSAPFIVKNVAEAIGNMSCGYSRIYTPNPEKAEVYREKYRRYLEMSDCFSR
jgi:hypothetical protein